MSWGVDGDGPRVLHQELGEVGLALGDIRRILYRGCTDYLVSVPGIDNPLLQQRKQSNLGRTVSDKD